MDSSKAKKAKSKAKARTKATADSKVAAQQQAAMGQAAGPRGITPEIQAHQAAMQNQTQTVNPYGRMGAMQPTVYNPGNVVSGGYAPQS
jgi:hypothetical protein